MLSSMLEGEPTVVFLKAAIGWMVKQLL
uniref:Uncharacterized protein n=1 Tax=Anguilla anguilla TaxID=7936 RepID=A0A0E9SB72_ANGAN